MHCPSSYFFTKLESIISGCSEQDAAHKTESLLISLKINLLALGFLVLSRSHVGFNSTQIQPRVSANWEIQNLAEQTPFQVYSPFEMLNADVGSRDLVCQYLVS